MTPTDPKRRQDAPPTVQDPAPGDVSRSPDPWGVKRAENLLTSLQDVLSARVEVSPVGEVTAVHVLTHSGTSAKQMVRNVESALLAQLGLKVDHRKISIAQTAEVKPIEALEQTAVVEEAKRRGIIFKSIEIAPAVQHRVRIKVTLKVNREESSGEEEAADTLKARLAGAARATLAVLDPVMPSGTFELEGVRTMREFDTELIVVAVNAVDGRESRLLSGSAEVRGGSAERAAVFAVLDATNRWVRYRT